MNNRNIICYFCHKRINGQYYFDWAKHTICASHIHNIIKCASCGQFCNSGAKDIGLNMKICAHCQKYRIERDDSGAIAQFINNIYQTSPIGRVTHWRLMMVDAEKLYMKTKNKNSRGIAQAVGSDYTIFIFRELSRVAFAQVLAHEMLHVFQYTKHIYPPKSLCEGFCNLGSYVILAQINNAEAQAAIDNMKNNPDSIYGEGFRQMLSVYETGGWEAAIQQIRNY